MWIYDIIFDRPFFPSSLCHVRNYNSCTVVIKLLTRPPGEFQRKKRFLKRLIFTEKRLKKVCQSQDLAIKICRQMQRYSLWSGLVTWRQGFSQRFVFLGFFFFLENFDVGQDGAKRCDAPRRTVCGGCGRAPHATGGGRGVVSRQFFCKYKLWEGHYRAILNKIKGPRKKRLKKVFHRNWEKKVFASKKS